VVLKFRAEGLRYLTLCGLVIFATSFIPLFIYPLQFLLDSAFVGLLVLVNSLSLYGILNFKPLRLMPIVLRIPKGAVYGGLVAYNIGWVLLTVPLMFPSILTQVDLHPIYLMDYLYYVLPFFAIANVLLLLGISRALWV
jgi:hypothetical protein